MTGASAAVDAASEPGGRVAHWIVLVGVIVVSTGFMTYFIDRGWIPHDEGTLAHSAERLLAGELPHRDYVDGYTGGLTYLNALAFKLFGVRLLAIRYVLLFAFVGWVLVFHQVAARILPPLGAGAVTLIAVFWSVPNYPAAMPSWYNLFLATAGVAAMLTYVDTGQRRWLVGAGFAGGVSVLMKSPGVMFVAAGLLFLLYHESRGPRDSRDGGGIGVAVQLGAAAILVAAVLSLLAIGFSRGIWLDLYQFAIPGGAMVALVARRVLRPGIPSRAAAGMLIRAAVAFLTGAAVPVVAFVAYYASAHALADLVRDVVLLPARTLVGASVAPPVPVGLLPTALAAFVVFDFKGARGRVAILQDALGFAVIALMLVPKTALTLEPVVWASLAEATPMVVVLLAVLITRREGRDGPSHASSRHVLLGCVAAFCSLVQYPFAAPIYFAYSLPLLLLALVVVIQLVGRARPRALRGMTCAYLLYGALYITPMKVPGLLGPVAREDVAMLDLPRAGLHVSRREAEGYREAVETLRAHAQSGVIFAGPDAPEMYFLAELRNPTPAIFDYLVADTLFHLHLVQRLDSLRVNAVAVKHRVWHSPELAADIQDSLAARYPLSSEIGDFTIRWR